MSPFKNTYTIVIKRILWSLFVLLFCSQTMVGTNVTSICNYGTIIDDCYFKNICSLIQLTPRKDRNPNYYVITSIPYKELSANEKEVISYLGYHNLENNSHFFKIVTSRIPPSGYTYLTYGTYRFFVQSNLSEVLRFRTDKRLKKTKYRAELSNYDLDYTKRSHWYMMLTEHLQLLYYRYGKTYCLRWDWKEVVMNAGDCEPLDFNNVNQ